jgi:hypothetical protein
MSQQTSYSRSIDNPFAGLLADIAPRDITSHRFVDTATGRNGRFVVRGSNDATCKLPTATSDVYLGPVIATAARELALGATQIAIESDDMVSALRRGGIYVEIDDTVTAGEAVCVRYSGKKQVQTLVFSGELVTDNVIDGKVGGIAISPVTFASNHATTMAALAAAILAANENILTAVVDTNTITVTTVQDAADQDLSAWVVTLGAGQVTAAITETVAAINSDQRGICRNDTDSTTAVEVDWEFEESGVTGNIVKIRRK